MRNMDSNNVVISINLDRITGEAESEAILEDLPFTHYPHQGRQLLGRVKGANAKHEYGLQFMKVTGQTRCAYCGMDFTASYENWVQMALDHVVPTSAGKVISINPDWLEDSASKVLACMTCNGYDNRFSLSEDKTCLETLEDYFDLRDRVFSERKKRIENRHQEERRFFDQLVKPIGKK